MDDSELSGDACTSKLEEKEPSQKKLNPVDFLLVTRVPMNVCTFQWVIRQFSILPKNITLYSTCIQVSDTTCYKLKLMKCDHGFNLFHVNQVTEHTCGKNVARNQNIFQSREINNVPSCTGLQLGFGSVTNAAVEGSTFNFTSPRNETKYMFGAPFQFSTSSSETKGPFVLSSESDSESGIGKLVFSSAHSKSSPDESSAPVQSEELKKAQNTNKIGITRTARARPSVEPTLKVQRDPKKTQNTNEFGITRIEYQISATDNQGKELMKWTVCFSDNSELLSSKIGGYANSTLEKFPDDSLILNCSLEIISAPTSEEMPIGSGPSLKCDGRKKLSEDFKALYQNSLGTDVTLVVGNERICVHKLILAARSSIFDKIFRHDMKESGQNAVIITDVQFPSLKKLIEFLYSGDFLDDDIEGMDLKEIYDLYYAADKYQVMDLRLMLGNSLMGRIQVDNASELLVWADRHNDEDLKSRIMNFIRINFEEVASTDTWKSFSLQCPRLAVEVVNLYVKNIKNSANKV